MSRTTPRMAGLTWQTAQPANNCFSSHCCLKALYYPDGKEVSLGWAATSMGACSGEKSTPNFTCQVNTALWQTQDGGHDVGSCSFPQQVAP